MTTKSGKLTALTVPANAISPQDMQRMWEVFQNYYDDISRESFEADLKPKSHVILVKDTGDQSVQGFSTLQVMRDNVQGRNVVAIFSGDTIIESSYWGQTALQKAFFRYIVKVKTQHPFAAVYWFLISKGYKTYLLLSRNFPEHWPRHEKATPPWQAAVLDVLARKKFGTAWKPEKGLLQFETCQGRLKHGVAGIEPHLLQAPDIRFFAEKNPNHLSGEELCCIGRVDLKLAGYYPFKLLRRQFFRSKKKSRRSGPGNRPS
jgi:hypothetical protein